MPLSCLIPRSDNCTRGVYYSVKQAVYRRQNAFYLSRYDVKCCDTMRCKTLGKQTLYIYCAYIYESARRQSRLVKIVRLRIRQLRYFIMHLSRGTCIYTTHTRALSTRARHSAHVCRFAFNCHTRRVSEL